MEKYLLTIEFRYNDAPKYNGDSTHNSKTTTIGIFDTFAAACKSGNNVLEVLESKFPLIVYLSGQTAEKERFSETGGCFKGKHTLITNTGYLKTPFDFYAKIETLKHDDLNTVLYEISEASKRFKNSLKN